MIHRHAEKFDSNAAVQMMTSGRNWPRSMYVAPDVNFKHISNMLMGLDFRYQADIVALMREEEPNIDEICRLLRESKEECADLKEIITAIMLTDSEILTMWEVHKNRAANSGTWMHAMLEHDFNGHRVLPGSMQGELDAARQITESMGLMEVFRTEWCIYATEEDLAGSIDLVLRDPVAEVLYLIDWKRSEKLADKYEGFGKFMKPPLQNVSDCQGEHYRLQLNIYMWILQKYYGVPVAGMKVVCVHPRYLPQGFVDDVPNQQELISVLMQSRRDELAAMRETQEPVDPRLADTQHFQVHGLSQASQDEALDDVETDLQHILEGQENDVPEAAKKRRHMPGASTHFLNLRKMLQHSDEVVAATLESYRPDACLRPNTILHNTSRTLAELRSCYPSLSEDVARLILVAGHMIEGTVGDKPMLADSAALIWMIEGQRHMRVHKGFMYVYDDDGCFLPFSGVPPEAVLQRVHAFFIYLEGIFRRMKPEMSKKFDACARAVVADLQTFTTEEEFLCALREAANTRTETPAYPARLDAGHDDEYECEDRDRAGASKKVPEIWTLGMADRAWKLSRGVRYELMQTRVISLLVEWCETEDQRQSGVCYDDTGFAYDRPDTRTPLTLVKKGPHNNCYIRIPHPLLDPVMKANKERLEKFYEQTFWCNMDVFRCFQAAIAIAKRGLNVDRCFIGISPGGVGQSLQPGCSI